jgi:hypothetical protein
LAFACWLTQTSCQGPMRQPIHPEGCGLPAELLQLRPLKPFKLKFVLAQHCCHSAECTWRWSAISFVERQNPMNKLNHRHYLQYIVGGLICQTKRDTVAAFASCQWDSVQAAARLQMLQGAKRMMSHCLCILLGKTDPNSSNTLEQGTRLLQATESNMHKGARHSLWNGSGFQGTPKVHNVHVYKGSNEWYPKCGCCSSTQGGYQGQAHHFLRHFLCLLVAVLPRVLRLVPVLKSLPGRYTRPPSLPSSPLLSLLLLASLLQTPGWDSEGPSGL